MLENIEASRFVNAYQGFLPEGWTIVADTGESVEFDIRDLKLLPILRGSGEGVTMTGMCVRAKNNGANLSLWHGKRILDRQRDLPKELRELSEFWLPLTGTLVRTLNSTLNSPSLAWYDKQLHLHFNVPWYGWYSYGSFVGLR